MAVLRMVLIGIFLIAAFAIIVIVLLQEGKSAGLGSLNGSSDNNTYWDKNKKHSLEGKFEKWTKITAGIFVLAAFALMFIPNQASSQIQEGTQVEETTTEGSTTEETTNENATTGETAQDENQGAEATGETDTSEAGQAETGQAEQPAQ